MSEHTDRAIDALTLAVRQAAQHLDRIAAALEKANAASEQPPTNTKPLETPHG